MDLKKRSTRVKWNVYLCFFLCAFGFLAGCRKPEPFDGEDLDTARWFSGGSQTVFDRGTGAYGHIFPDLDAGLAAVHDVGDLQFEQTFVSAPAAINPGLGPVFNSVSCTSCHVNDGRASPAPLGSNYVGFLWRIGVPGTDEYGGPAPVPGFGGQLQQRAIAGAQPEGQMLVTYGEQGGAYADGNPYSLRVPSYAVGNAYTTWPANAMISPRLAPAVFGLGLLEAIPEADITSRADEGDMDGDGISGKAQRVWDPVHQRQALGRFGWKAGTPSVLVQTAGAYHQDMGITTPIFQLESSQGQPQDDGYNDDAELSDSLLHAVAFYVRTLAVPGRRDADVPQVLAGEQLFTGMGCTGCHVPEQRTAVDVAFPAISNQRIFPYTDVLLHDMGDGLSDGRPDNLADGREWRTPALWGIGLSQQVNGHQEFLHDGRARGLEEAILWHGGEAEASKQRFVQLSAAERAAVVAFLRSL
ncbi:MAG: di-heme oxidoredictase family protein [Flavobacteriales bacterium]